MTFGIDTESAQDATTQLQPCEGKATAAHDEQDLWAAMDVSGWKDTISKNSDTIFGRLYGDTLTFIERQIEQGSHDVVVEIGCGTGEIIGSLAGVHIPRIGIDINPGFIDDCKATYGDSVGWHVADATRLQEWWCEAGFDKFKRPLILCVNNTIMIMPECIRGLVVQSMIDVAGTEGRCLMSFWSGNHFKLGVEGYYAKNPSLCGEFDPTSPDHVDHSNRILTTPSGYSSRWLLGEEVAEFFKSSTSATVPFNGTEAEVPRQIDPSNGALEVGLGIFAHFKST